MPTQEPSDSTTIQLSKMTEALLKALSLKKRKDSPLEGEQYTVSHAVSFFGFAYEKIRNAVEFHEEHLIRRHAISRILRRRLAINPHGSKEGENIVRELLWGRYVPENEFSVHDVKNIQNIVDKYILLFSYIKKQPRKKVKYPIGSKIIDLMSCEIEESINEEYSHKQAAFLYFFYQTLRNKIHIADIPIEKRDAFFYAASEKALAKNDNAFVLYHLFVLRYGTLINKSDRNLETIASDFENFVIESSEITRNVYSDKLIRFAKLQAPPFKILQEVLKTHSQNPQEVLSDADTLKQTVEEICSLKYKQTGNKLRNAATRSITYIFFTKMIFVLLLEVPLTRLLYHHIDFISIGINTLFPPVFMGMIVSVINPPSSKNTERIYRRIVEIIDSDSTFETQAITFSKKSTAKNPVLFFVFSVLYILTFGLVFGSIYFILDELGFNIISKGIFIFFISVVTFFAYRIRQTAKEYVLMSENNVLLSIGTFLFLPILYLGKLLSEQISRVNLFIIFFDYLIEAPFKFIIDIVEEWTTFLRDKKDELV